MSKRGKWQIVGFTGFLLLVLGIATGHGLFIYPGAVLLIAVLASGKVALFG